jgi:hypothetical protein
VERPADEQMGLARQALEKAQSFLRQLIEQQEELERDPPKIAPDKLAMGRVALQNAIASARRTVVALQDALGTVDAPRE